MEISDKVVSVEKNWLQHLVCPFDRSVLDVKPNSLICTECGTSFPVENGIPNFINNPRNKFSTRWKAAQQYELSFWEEESQSLREARQAQLRNTAVGLSQLFDTHSPHSWRKCILQIGTAAEAEISYLAAEEKYAAEPLACELNSRGLLVGENVRWINATGERLPAPDNCFSLILITNVIDHVSDPKAVLSEIRRCLAPGGIAWISCHVSNPIILSIFYFLRLLGIGYFSGHLWYYSPVKLDRLCKDAGFNTRHIQTLKHTFSEPGVQNNLRRILRPFLLKVRYLLLSDKPVNEPNINK